MRSVMTALLLFASTPSFAMGQQALSVTLQNRQESTAKIVEVPNGSIFGIKRHRKVVADVRAVQRQFEMSTTDGTRCLVTAMVLEDMPVLDAKQSAEVAPACDEAERNRAAAVAASRRTPEQAASDAHVQAKAPPLAVRIQIYQQMAYMTPRDFAELTPAQQRQNICDHIAEKIDIQLQYERHGSHGIYNMDALRHAGPDYCRAYLMSIR